MFTDSKCVPQHPHTIYVWKKMAKMNTWIGEASHFAMLPFDLLCDLFCLVLILILFTFYYSFVYIYSSNDVSLVFAIGCFRWLAGWRLCFYFFCCSCCLFVFGYWLFSPVLLYCMWISGWIFVRCAFCVLALSVHACVWVCMWCWCWCYCCC